METIPLKTPALCTVGWFVKTDIYIFAVQPIYPVRQNYHNFFYIISAVLHSLVYACLQYLLLFRIG